MDEQKYKLVTRRILAWGVIFLIVPAVAFAIIYGAVTRQTDIFTAGMTGGGTMAGVALTYYFTTKTSEE